MILVLQITLGFIIGQLVLASLALLLQRFGASKKRQAANDVIQMLTMLQTHQKRMEEEELHGKTPGQYL